VGKAEPPLRSSFAHFVEAPQKSIIQSEAAAATESNDQRQLLIESQLEEANMAEFKLQPAANELQALAERFWNDSGEKWQEAEQAAFNAGSAIRGSVGNEQYTLENLETIVRWKSERVVHYLSENSPEKIEAALTVAASPDSSTEDAMEALTNLSGVGVPVASAILTAIFPERYTVIDFRALEALGFPLQDRAFYSKYLAFCTQLANSGIIQPQGDLPAPTALRALDRALWQWSKERSQNPKR
jgi:hypothetical protein